MTPGELSDLLGRVGLGDRESFRLLYKHTSAKLYGVCLRLLRDRAAAEDCLQDIYVKIWRNASKYAVSEYGPIAWLVAIARNEAIDKIRSRKSVVTGIEDALEVASNEPDPEMQAESSSEMLRIENCLGQLKAEHAEAVRSAYLEGHSYQDLASRYRLPINTLRTWLRRSLLQLRECLQQ